MEKIKISDKKRFQNESKKKWDVLLPPMPIIEFDPSKPKLNTVAPSDNWGNSFLEIDSNIEKMLKLAKRKIHVFVLDTAAQYNNQFLVGVDHSLSKSFTHESNLIDANGHSTHCAGIVSSNHPTVKLGLARELAKAGLLKITPIKVLTDEGGGSYLWFKEAIDYVTNLPVTDEIKIISLSLGGAVDSSLVETSVKAAIDKGIFIFCAAGNSGNAIGNKSTVNFPGRLVDVFAISSLDSVGTISSFSSTGPEIDLSCPGRGIWSTYLNNTLASLSGTSMACPEAVAAAAWILSIHTNIKTQSQLYSFMTANAIDIGGSGFDNLYGFGAPKMSAYLKEVEPDPPIPVKKINLTWWLIGGILLIVLLILFVNLIIK